MTARRLPRYGARGQLLAIGRLASRWVIACGVAAILLVVAACSPSFTTAEQDYLQQIKLGRAKPDAGRAWYPWPSDKTLVDQGHQICATLRDNPDLIAQAVVFMDTVSGLPQWTDQSDWQIQSAIGTLCADQLGKWGIDPRNVPAGPSVPPVLPSAPGTQSRGPLPTWDATSPEVRPFFEALDAAQILQLGSIYSPDILGAANHACAERASGRDLNSINASVSQELRALGLDWVTGDVSGGIVSIAFTQLCPR
jgi:hypothetical protein